MSRMYLPKFCVFSVLICLSLQFGSSSSKCIALENCETLSWLNAMKGQISFGEKIELFKCNDVDDDLVHCPEVEEVKPDEDGNTTGDIEVDCNLGEPGCTDSSA